MLCINRRRLKVIEQFRLLWNQHAAWTRFAINAIVLELPNEEEEEVNRLLRNPVDFGKALCRFYGEKKARHFTKLLTEHLTLAAAMIKAMMAGNNAEAARIKKEWYTNGDEIVRFLAAINPYWSYKQWRKMFFVHLGYVTDLATTLMNGKYTENVKIYDKFEIEALMMGDMMAYGIIKQFKRRLR